MNPPNGIFDTFRSSDGCPHGHILSTQQSFAEFCGHVIAIYDIFAKNWHLFQFLAKTAHGKQ